MTFFIKWLQWFSMVFSTAQLYINIGINSNFMLFTENENSVVPKYEINTIMKHTTNKI